MMTVQSCEKGFVLILTAAPIAYAHAVAAYAITNNFKHT